MPTTSYNDTALGERPPVTGTTGGGTASEKNPHAVGHPEIQQNDGTSSPRVSVKTLRAENLSTPKGSKSYPPGVTSYSDAEV